MRVLAIDASLRNTGVAIVDANNGKPQSVYFGTIHNKSAMRPSSCLVCIRDRLAELIREHAPDCCALESVIYVQSYKTAIILGAARGAASEEKNWRTGPLTQEPGLGQRNWNTSGIEDLLAEAGIPAM